MAAHMQEVLAQYVAPLLAHAAQNQIGLDERHSYQAIEKSIPAVLAGVLNHVRDEHAAKRFFNLLTGTSVHTQWLAADGVQTLAVEPLLQLGQQWQGLLFGQQAPAVVVAVAQDADIEPAQAQTMLNLAVPTVLAALKKWIQLNQYSQHRFYEQLVAQEAFLSKIFSPNLLAALGIPSALVLVAGVRQWGEVYFAEATAPATPQDAPLLRTTPPPVLPSAAVPPPVRAAWLKWVLVAAVAGILAWLGFGFLNSDRGAVPQAPSVASDVVASDTVVVAASAPVAASAVTHDAASAPVAALSDKVVYENNALKFYFATGSAAIAPDAVQVAAPMVAAANEGKRLRISGYNDKTGDAESNEWLAKKRAQAVRSFLRKQGVKAAQLELVKPEYTTGQSGSLAQDRRVEVTVISE